MKTISKQALKNVLKLNNLTTEDVDNYLGFKDRKNSLTQIVNYSSNPIPANLNGKIEDFLNVHNISCDNLFAVYNVNYDRGDIKMNEEYNYDVIKSKAAKLGFNLSSLSCFIVGNKSITTSSAEAFISTVFRNKGNMNSRQIDILAALLETSREGLKNSKSSEKAIEFKDSYIPGEYNISEIFITLNSREQEELRKDIKVSEKIWNKIRTGELKINHFFLERFVDKINSLFGNTFTVEEIISSTKSKKEVIMKDNNEGKEEKPSKNRSPENINKMFDAYWSVFKNGYIEKKEFSKILNITYSVLDKMIDKKEQEVIAAKAIKKEYLSKTEEKEKMYKEELNKKDEEIRVLWLKYKDLLSKSQKEEDEISILRANNSKLQNELEELEQNMNQDDYNPSVKYDSLDSLTKKELNILIIDTLLFAKTKISSEDMYFYSTYTACLSKMMEIENEILK